MSNNAEQKTAEKMLKAEHINTVLGVIVALFAIGGAVGSWYVLPYRISQAEESIAKLQIQLDNARTEAIKNQELLIRMDERIQTIQAALKIKATP